MKHQALSRPWPPCARAPCKVIIVSRCGGEHFKTGTKPPSSPVSLPHAQKNLRAHTWATSTARSNIHPHCTLRIPSTPGNPDRRCGIRGRPTLDERPRTCRRRQTLPEHVQGDDIVLRSRSTDLPRDPTTCRQGAGPDRRRRSRSQPGYVRIDGMMM